MIIRKQIHFRFMLTIVVLMFFYFGTKAQNGTLKGTIIDSITKKPIPFAEISIYNLSKFSVYISNTTKSNINGEYAFYSVPVGTYYVTIHYLAYSFIFLPNNISQPIVTPYLFLSEKVLITKNKINCKNFSGIPNRYIDDPGTIELDSIFSGQSLNSEVIKRMPW